ncbi:4-hydroxythreonine-4-phosphate dehydrogenase PdxA [Rhodoplanes serenus]|uniref:4-hydroxythreonine-4-phosphate dehydrogenase PdxA n=1 Tax=Rhodoplanes serenus TaxID=200615 RepID=UPI000DADC1CC|nr:4-hydroxythreonine-4-phosphate dehydrogenase PdxA [Rhodoplanes serenus]RAI34842.1 4-hydroxythreonine-4-phosphate dehydrogenase [Rhodoplanes serenus]
MNAASAPSPRPSRPTIALAMGDPAGISPELLAKALAEPDITAAADLVIFGDRRILDGGARVAGTRLDIDVVDDADAVPAAPTRPVLVDLKNLDPADVMPGEATLAGGRFATDNFRRALRHAAAGHAEAVVFTPFNKKAMRLAYAGYDDEIRFIADVLAFDGPAREFNVLEEVWNARVTSHLPLAAVSAAITGEAIVRNLALTDACMRAAGFARPRIAVAGLNPHAGDGGNFGTEEIDVIEPAVREAASKGYAASGPYPADTVFVRARRGEFDAVLTMYHDQGQIAMKLMGFDRGVTLFGGFPFPICTPAHGTAYDIVGRGIADIGAMRHATLLAARMATSNAAPAAAAAATEPAAS